MSVNEGAHLEINTGLHCIVKPFNTELQFHEFHKKLIVTDNTYICSSLKKATESSIRSRFPIPTQDLNLIAIFLEDKGNLSDKVKLSSHDLRVDIFNFLFDVFFSGKRDTFFPPDNITINLLRDAAIEIERKYCDFNLSQILMSRANQLRPQGKFIASKLIQYDKLISDLNEKDNC